MILGQVYNLIGNQDHNQSKNQNILYVGTHLKVQFFEEKGSCFSFFLFAFIFIYFPLPKSRKNLEKNWNRSQSVRFQISKKWYLPSIRTQPGLSALPVHSVVSFQRQHVVHITGFTLTRCSLLSSVRLLPTTWRQVLFHRSRHSVVRKGSKLQDWAMPPCVCVRRAAHAAVAHTARLFCPTSPSILSKPATVPATG